MVERESRRDSAEITSISRAFWACVVTLVTFSVASLLLIFWLTSAMTSDGIRVNMSGRQRMLTQRLVAMAYATSARPEEAPRLAVIRGAWEAGWTRLGDGAVPIDQSATYAAADISYNNVVKALAATDTTARVDRLDTAAQQFVGDLDVLTSALATGQARRVSRLRLVQGFFTAALIAILLLLHRVAMRPAIRSAYRMVTAQQQLNAQLSTASEALATSTDELEQQNERLFEQRNFLQESEEELKAQQATLLEQRAQLQDSAVVLSRFSGALDATPDYVIMVALDGTLVYANPAAQASIQNVSRHRGLRLLRYLGRDDARRFQSEVLPEVMQSGVWQGQLKLRPISTEEQHANVTIMAQRDRFGYIDVFVIIAHDMRAEYELRESLALREALHRAVIDSLAEGVVVQDREGNIVTWNQSAARILEFSDDQLAGRVPYDERWEATYADGRPLPSDERPISRARLRGESVDAFQMCVTAQTGHTRHLSVNARPMFVNDLDDRPGAVATFSDVTSQVALSEEMQRLSLIVKQSDYAVTITDRDSRITWVNDAFTELTGYQEAESIGQSAIRLRSGIHSAPESLARMRDAVEHGESLVEELLCYRRDGTPYWAEVAMTPLRDAQGTLTGFVSLSRNVTARRVADRERQTLAAALAVTADGIAIVDAVGALEFTNEAFLRQLGVGATDLQGRVWLTLYDQSTAQALTSHVRQTVTTMGFWNGEVGARRENGTEFPQELSITALPHGGTVVVVRDISDRKQAEDRLRYLSMRDELTGLLNRRGFMEVSRPVLAGALRAGQPCALLYGDLDKFKLINDKYGHGCGDRALQEVSKILVATFRTEDIVARLGGDEFTVLARGLEPADVPALLVRLEETMAAHNARRAGDPLDDWHLGLSLGVAYAEAGDAQDFEALLKRADAEQYFVKSERRRRSAV